jgi:hypothetical protein
MKKDIVIVGIKAEKADKAILEVDDAAREVTAALDSGKIRPSGLVSDTCGLVRDASRLVQDASGLLLRPDNLSFHQECSVIKNCEADRIFS